MNLQVFSSILTQIPTMHTSKAIVGFGIILDMHAGKKCILAWFFWSNWRLKTVFIERQHSPPAIAGAEGHRMLQISHPKGGRWLRLCPWWFARSTRGEGCVRPGRRRTMRTLVGLYEMPDEEIQLWFGFCAFRTPIGFKQGFLVQAVVC